MFHQFFKIHVQFGDKNPNEQELATKKFKEISEAYEVLADGNYDFLCFYLAFLLGNFRTQTLHSKFNRDYFYKSWI